VRQHQCRRHIQVAASAEEHDGNQPNPVQQREHAQRREFAGGKARRCHPAQPTDVGRISDRMSELPRLGVMDLDQSRTRRLSFRLLVSALSIAAVLALAACGDDADSGQDAGGDGNVTELAFLTGMVPHHESAIEMAEIAREQGTDPFVTGLADDIISAQRAEIRQLRSIHQRLFDKRLVPDPAAHEGLSLTASEAGMNHTSKMMDELRTAKPFDRAFVDAMVAHHQGAIRMAEVLLGSGENEELRTLAQKIIDDQQREIDEMTAFRQDAYGSPPPTASDDTEQSAPTEDHSAH
jgi:uncharacterized protein (DUF305 family)